MTSTFDFRSWRERHSASSHQAKGAAPEGGKRLASLLGVLIVGALVMLSACGDQGNANAQFKLGLKYDKGDGVPKDGAEAVKWYRMAAAQGHAEAQCNLGVMYADGEGVPKDDVEAVKWFRMAADQGDASAQYILGLMYHAGEGVPKDLVQAHIWYSLTASRSSGSLQVMAVSNRESLAKLMTAAQIAEAQARAREWKPGE